MASFCAVTCEESKKACAFAASISASSSCSSLSSVSSLPLSELSPSDCDDSLFDSFSELDSFSFCEGGALFFPFRWGLPRTLRTSDSIEWAAWSASSTSSSLLLSLSLPLSKSLPSASSPRGRRRLDRAAAIMLATVVRSTSAARPDESFLESNDSADL